MKRKLFVLYTFLILTLVIPLFGQEGKIDTSFGNMGFVFVDLGTKNDISQSSFPLKDNKIILVGQRDNYVYTMHSALLRINSNGIIDTSFGDTGVVYSTLQHLGEYASDIAVQEDDKLIVCGNYYNNIPDLSTPQTDDSVLISQYMFSRFNENGQPDLSFGYNGKVYYMDDTSFILKKIFLQNDGKILGAGEYNDVFFVVRFNSNGTSDSSFNGNGIVTVDFEGDNYHKVGGLCIQQDQKILVGGRVDLNDGYFAAFRLNTDGSLDSTFGNNGKVKIQQGGRCNSVNIQRDNKIVLAGSSGEGFTSIRLHPDGSKDNTYGYLGKALVLDSSICISSILQPDQKLIMVGEKYNSTFSIDHIAMARVNSDGSIDTSFGTFGSVIYNGDLNGYKPNKVTLQKDGNIIVSGWVDINDGINDADFFVVRFIADSSFYTKPDSCEIEPELCDTTTNNSDGLVHYSETVPIKTFPNPNTGIFIISSNKEKIKKISVYNFSGQKIKQFEKMNVNTFEINLSPIQKGIYLIHIETEKSRKIKKILIE